MFLTFDILDYFLCNYIVMISDNCIEFQLTNVPYVSFDKPSSINIESTFDSSELKTKLSAHGGRQRRELASSRS